MCRTLRLLKQLWFQTVWSILCSLLKATSHLYPQWVILRTPCSCSSKYLSSWRGYKTVQQTLPYLPTHFVSPPPPQFWVSALGWLVCSRQLLYSNGLVIASRLLSVDQLRIKSTNSCLSLRRDEEFWDDHSRGWHPHVVAYCGLSVLFFLQALLTFFSRTTTSSLTAHWVLSLSVLRYILLLHFYQPSATTLPTNPTVRCLLVDTTVLRPTPIHRWERQSEEYKWW